MAQKSATNTYNTRTYSNPETEIQFVLDGDSHSGNVFYGSVSNLLQVHLQTKTYLRRFQQLEAKSRQ